ncbi:major facilitator superfamily domain-containing protein [Entophlyctis helioformis]|nr:major facilitator superfamily domain-containing protein [Entophlyctis helioformis]
MANHSINRRLTTLAVSSLVMAVAGSLFTFSVFSDGLRRRFGFSSADVNLISGVGNTALYLSFLVIGPVYDTFGGTVTMIMATAAYSLGYALMWAAYVGALSFGSSSVTAIACFYFLAGFGSTAAYMAVVGINISNFPAGQMGITTGILLLFYGLSGTIYAQIYTIWYSGQTDSTGGFLLFLAISVAAVNVVGVFTMATVPAAGVSDVESSRAVAGKQAASAAAARGPITERSALLMASEADDAASPDGDANNEAIMMTDTHGHASAGNHEPPSRSKRPDGQPKARLLDDNAGIASPIDILKSPYFWLYAMVCIWQQGLTYVSNVSTIVTAIGGPGQEMDAVAKVGALHVTILSVGQSIGRFSFGIISDMVVSKLHKDRSVLLIVAELALIVPHFLLAVLGESSLRASSGALLYFCSASIGLGWGAAGALFPPLTKDLFGTTFYGTACAFVMMGVPVGILASNLVFGFLYDAALKLQVPVNGSAATECYGSTCFNGAFVAALAMQVVPLGLSIVLFLIRSGKQRIQQGRIGQDTITRSRKNKVCYNSLRAWLNVVAV